MGWAHPRSRGEHAAASISHASLWGSSPLARGTLSYIRDIAACSGLIPARAGNTHRRRLECASRRAHPRSRGEHYAPYSSAVGNTGSSPLARGTRSFHPRACRWDGLIPARAGNTGLKDSQGLNVRAHPRSRGEHVDGQGCSVLAVGSSPLARGTQVRPIWAAGFRGLIPARAGNTTGQLTCSP